MSPSLFYLEVEIMTEDIFTEIQEAEIRISQLKRKSDMLGLSTDAKNVRDDYLYELGRIKGLKTAYYLAKK